MRGDGYPNTGKEKPMKAEKKENRELAVPQSGAPAVRGNAAALQRNAASQTETPQERKKANKKLNTVLFMLAAVIVCMLITIVVFSALFFVMVWLNKITGDELFLLALPAAFIMSIVASFLIYNGILKLIFKKIDIDEYFDPIKLRWWK
jgi:uncharacterized membrane protein